MPDPPTLQDILKRQQAGGFVGRAEQLARFEENLRLGADDERRKLLFSLHGGAGVGKTTLLKQLLRVAREHGSATGFVDEAAYDVPSSLELIQADLASQSIRCKRLRKRLTDYRRRRHELDSDPRAPSPLTKSAVGVALNVAKEVPIVRTAAGGLDTETVAGEVARYQDYLRRKFRSPDVVQLLLSPAKVLTPAFLADLREIAETQPIALFFDTYEYTGTFLEPWLLDLLAGRFGAAPPNIVLTLAGQHPLALNKWSEYLPARSDMPLAPFTEDEARRLLTARGVTNDDVVEAILGRSGRLPLLVASYSEGSPESLDELGDPTNDVVERFLKWEPEPRRRKAALLGALPRWLNQDVYAVVAGSTTSADDYARLRSLSFVKEHTYGVLYHDLARKAMVRQIRATTPGEWQRRHRALTDYFRSTKEALGLTGRAAWKNEKWQHLAMEEHYHALCSGSGEALRHALGGLAAAYAWLPAMVPRWARTIHQAGADSDDATLIRRGKRLAILAESETADDRIRLLTELAEDTGLDPQWRAVGYAERGDIRRDQTEFEAALADLNRAVELWPEMDWIVAYRGEVFRLVGRLDDAITEFDRALDLRPDNAWTVASRAQTYEALDRIDDALADLNRAVDIDPAHTWAVVQRAKLLSTLGRHDDALADYNRAVDLDPSDSWALTARGSFLRERGRREDALADFARGVEVDPDYVWARACRAELLRQLGRIDDALADLDHVLRVEPGYEWALFERADIRENLDRTEDALADLNNAVAIDPSDVYAKRSRVRLLRRLDRNDEALTDLNGALEVAPDDRLLLVARGDLLAELGRLDEALADLNHAVAIEPDDAWALVNRADVLDELCRSDDALADLERAVQIAPPDKWTLVSRARMYRRLERLDEALADLNRAIDLDPTDTWVLINRSIPLAGLGRHDEALADLNRAIELEPDNDWALDRRARLMSRLGRTDSALADFARSLEHEPKSGWTHYQVALALRAQNKPAAARERLARAIEVDRANTHRFPGDGWRAFNVAVYLLALDDRERAERQVRDTLAQLVTPKDIRTAIKDFEDLCSETGQDVASCVEILRAALAERVGFGEAG